MMRLTKLQLNYRGFCTPCIKSGKTTKNFNHITGLPCEPANVYDIPEDTKVFYVKEVRNNVIVSFS
jgi:hypothetical protein